MGLLAFFMAFIDLISPIWFILIFKSLRRKHFPIWKAWGTTSSIWLALTYFGARTAVFTFGHYFLLYIAFTSLEWTGEMPANANKVYSEYISNDLVSLRFWTIPPIIIVVLPTIVLYLISKFKWRRPAMNVPQ